MQRKFGQKVAHRVGGIRTLFRDALNFGEVIEDKRFRTHSLKGTRSGQFALELDRQYRLIIELIDDPKQKDRNHDICSRIEPVIQIIEIVDYH